MKKYLNKYRGQTFRLQSWDYASSAFYFVTISLKDRIHFFGEIENGKMILSEIGEIVKVEWLKTKEIRTDMNIELGEFVIMPDHFHAIIYIGDNEFNSSGGAMHCATTEHCATTKHRATTNITTEKNQFGPQSKNLASIIRGFKSSVTTWCRKNNYSDFAWQKLFYEHIIRNQQSFENISNYIINNPKNWKKDKLRKEI